MPAPLYVGNGLLAGVTFRRHDARCRHLVRGPCGRGYCRVLLLSLRSRYGRGTAGVTWLLATYKYLLSFRKAEWTLEDYPVRLRERATSAETPALRAWCAQIVNWWLMAGFGDTPEGALEDLRGHSRPSERGAISCRDLARGRQSSSRLATSSAGTVSSRMSSSNASWEFVRSSCRIKQASPTSALRKKPPASIGKRRCSMASTRGGCSANPCGKCWTLCRERTAPTNWQNASVISVPLWRFPI